MVRKSDEFEDKPEPRERLNDTPGAPKPRKASAAGEGEVEGIVEDADEAGVLHKRDELSEESRPRAGWDAPPRASKRRPSRPFSWKESELGEQREKLVARRQQLREDMIRLRGEAAGASPAARGETSSLPMHLADAGTEAFEQARDLALAEQEGLEIQAIDAAIDRLEAGTYGICADCGRSIDKDRLLALPHAALCFDCQFLLEQE